MRKILPIALLMFIAVAAGGYCIAWFSQASQIKKGIERAIVQINSKQKYITYDSIETSGFPSDVYVSIVNPHFSGRIDEVLRAVQAASHQPDAAQTIPQWDEDIKLNGQIIIGINALSHHYSLRISGNWQRNAKIGAQALSIGSESSSETVCLLQMAHSGGIFSTLWDYHGLVRDNAKDFFRDFRLFDCNGPAHTVSDLVSHDKLINNGPWRFYASNTPNGAAEEVRFYIKVSDVEITPQGDAMLALQRNAFSPNFNYPIKYSLFGKENVEIDLSYNGPADWKASGNNPPVDITLSKFDINSQLHTMNATSFLKNTPNGANRTVRLVYKAQENFSAPYDSFLRDMVHGYIQGLNNQNAQMSHDGKPVPSPFRQYFEKYTPDQLYAIVIPALPDLNSLGTLVQSLDIGYEGAADFSNGEVTLSDIELSASPYGIKGNGNIKRATGQLFPDGHTILTCSNCMNLVDDAIAYAARVQKVVSYFQTPEQLAAETPVDSRLAEGIKAFLKALSTPTKQNNADTNSFAFVINSDQTTGITVNGKNINEVFAMYKEYIGPLLKTPANTGIAAPQPTPAAPAAPTVAPPPPTR